MPHDLRTARSAQHSFADMKASKDGRKPSVGMNAKRKEPLDKLARHMSQHIDANAVRSAAAMVRVCSGFARLKSSHVRGAWTASDPHPYSG